MKNIFKNILKYLCVIVLVVGFGFSLAACKPKVVAGYVKDGTLQTTVMKGEELDLSNVVVVVSFSDKATLEVSVDKLHIGQIDTSMSGVKQLPITYGGFTFYVPITVITDDEGVTVTSMVSELLSDYNANKSEKQNKQTEFNDRNQPLYVGDDNKFNFRINANGIDAEGNLVTNISKVRSNITVTEIASDGTRYLLEGDALNRLVAVDTDECTFDFTVQSIGKTFEISVSALNFDEDYDTSKRGFTATVEVVDGFNVYNARELSVYDNHNMGYNEIKSSLGLRNTVVNGIVLQNDIKITREDVAPNLFYTKYHPNYSTASGLTNLEVSGTPIDDAGSGVYHRVFKNGEKFTFLGNYFSIDASAFPKMVVEGTTDLKKGVNTEKDQFMTSHFSLFYNTDGSETPSNTSNLDIKNVYFIGNGALNGDVVNSGAIIMMKTTRVNTNVYNTVTHNFYIGYFWQKGGIGGAGNQNNGQYVVDNSKGYNSYQCLMYMSGANHVLITNSEFKGAGGPAIIADYVPPKDEIVGWPTRIDVVDSTIESIVSGKEPWFAGYGVGKVVQALAGLDAFFDGSNLAATGKTIVAEKQTVNEDTVLRINMMVLMKERGAKPSSSRIPGYVRMFENMDDYETQYGLNGKTQANVVYGLDLDKGIRMDPQTGTLSCDPDKKDDVANKAFGGVTYIESQASGGYINEGYGAKKNGNYDASIVGSTKAMGIAAALSIKDFNTKPLDQQKAILKGAMNQMAEANINAVYNGCITQGALDEIENFNNLALAEKRAAICAQIDAFSNVSYSEGNYLNVYANTGMGVLLQLYSA